MRDSDTSRSFARQTLHFVWRMAVSPHKTVEELVSDPRKAAFGAVAAVLLGLCYTATVYVGWTHGFGAVVDPWLPIPAEEYYLYETFFALPVYMIVYVSAAGAIQLLLRSVGGSGSFEDVFAVVTLASTLPTLLLMWLPETVLLVLAPDARAEPLGGFAGLPSSIDSLRQLLVPIWLIVASSLALARSHRVAVYRAMLATVIGLVPAGVIAFTYIR